MASNGALDKMERKVYRHLH